MPKASERRRPLGQRELVERRPQHAHAVDAEPGPGERAQAARARRREERSLEPRERIVFGLERRAAFEGARARGRVVGVEHGLDEARARHDDGRGARNAARDANAGRERGRGE